MEKKNSVTFIVAIICIVLCIPLGIIIGMYLSVNEENRNVTNNIVNNTVNNSGDKETISIDSQIVTDAMKSFNALRISEKNLYNGNSYNISSISDYDLLYTAVWLLANEGNQNITSTCTSSEFGSAISFETINSKLSNYILNKTVSSDTFKSLTSFSTEIVKEGYNLGKYGVILDKDGIKVFAYCIPTGPGDYIDTKIISAEKNENYVYVYEKVVFASYNEDYVLSYYKDYQNNILVENDVYSLEEGFDIKDPNWDLYNTYKYTFKIVDDKYYFQSYEMVG